LPTARTPPAALEQTNPAYGSRMTVRLANAFVTKIRRGERIATSRCRQVPSRSSAANTSPATTEVSNGSTHMPEAPSPTSGAAQPVACSQRPNTVSAGSSPCLAATATTSAGPIQAATSSSRIRHWDSSLTSSKRYPRVTGTRGAAIVAVIGRLPAFR
jgi:hypothetical protein